jgi:hypothetical protein
MFTRHVNGERIAMTENAQLSLGLAATFTVLGAKFRKGGRYEGVHLH